MKDERKPSGARVNFHSRETGSYPKWELPCLVLRLNGGISEGSRERRCRKCHESEQRVN